VSRQSANPNWRELALGMAITDPGSSRYNRTGDWRSSRPVWEFEKCVKCGVCAVFCPEGCIEMQPDGLPLADMDYCKGCGICILECWTGCIELKEESD
jgi:pyruvate ferredoxin oxidoreductase delta subunit